MQEVLPTQDEHNNSHLTRTKTLRLSGLQSSLNAYAAVFTNVLLKLLKEIGHDVFNALLAEHLCWLHQK